MGPTCHEPRDMGHVNEEKSTDRVGNFTHALEIDDPRVGGRTGGNHLGTAFLGQSGQGIIIDRPLLAAHPVVDDIVKFTRKIRFVPVREVSAVGEVHGENPVADGQRGKINRGICLAAAVGLHIGMLGPEKFLGPFDGQRLDHVDMLAATVPTPPRITLGIFVGQGGTLRLAHCATGEILGGNKLDVFELTALLVMDGGGDGRVDFLDGGNIRRFVGRPGLGGCVHGVFLSGH